MIAIEFLIAMEDGLRTALDAPETFVLADYFDYIGGTSTGAIIATALSFGMSAHQVRALYREHGAEMFTAARMRDRLKYRYTAEALKHILQTFFGIDATLGSDRLRTLLLLILRNATTDSPWPISNNPKAKYNDETLAGCNLRLPIWQLVRASTAAPVYFPPEVIKIGDETFIFADGGITTYNNPAFLLFLMATLDAYRLEWPAAVDKMLLVSIGTGLISSAREHLRPDQLNVLYNAEMLPAALIRAATAEQDMLCRVFGETRAGLPLDSELGDLRGSRGPATHKLFTYVRYDADLSRGGLDALGLPQIGSRDVSRLDGFAQIDAMSAVGNAAAKRQFSIEDFRPFLAAPHEFKGTASLR